MMDEGKLCDELTVVIKSAMHELITDCNGYKSIVDNQKAKIAELKEENKRLQADKLKALNSLKLFCGNTLYSTADLELLNSILWSLEK
ncbi:MAG: hypothetical protein GY928_05390, partial [Colwellia sp.]|nr:hypothetical protein [Colwellia sp.]